MRWLLPKSNTLLKNSVYILFLFNKSELLEVLLISSMLKILIKRVAKYKNCAQFQQLKVLNRVKLRKFVSWKKRYKCAILKWFEKHFKKFDMVLVNICQSYEQPFKKFLVPDKLFRTRSNFKISKKFMRCSNLSMKLAVFLPLWCILELLTLKYSNMWVVFDEAIRKLDINGNDKCYSMYSYKKMSWVFSWLLPASDSTVVMFGENDVERN